MRSLQWEAASYVTEPYTNLILDNLSDSLCKFSLAFLSMKIYGSSLEATDQISYFYTLLWKY